MRFNITKILLVYNSTLGNIFGSLAPATFFGVINSGESYQQHDLYKPDYGDQLVSELTYSKRPSSEDNSQERR